MILWFLFSLIIFCVFFFNRNWASYSACTNWRGYFLFCLILFLPILYVLFCISSIIGAVRVMICLVLAIHLHLHTRSPHLTIIRAVMFLPYNKSRISLFPIHLQLKVLSRLSSSCTSIINILCWACPNVLLHTKPAAKALALPHPFYSLSPPLPYVVPQ